MTLIQKYNDLVKTPYKIHSKNKERYRIESDRFYNMVKESMTSVDGEYVLYIPAQYTFSGRDQELRFKTLPWESVAYGVKHE